MSNNKAPIDPNQLLAAFAPLLTRTGGIKNANEVPRLSSLMMKFSRKLVSRCVYCNVLLATSPDVLEEFLRSGGWKTIDQWIQSAKELGNKPFLNELCDLLLKLPMTVERLREEHIKTPKIINKLSKSDDPQLAPKAKLIVEKWKKMIETVTPGLTKDKDHNNKDHKKKRKKDSTNSDTKESNDTKKPKMTPSAVDINSNDSSLSLDWMKDDASTSKVERTPRPSTAKVKPGKSRLTGLVSSQTNSKAIKPRKESPIVPKNNKLNAISIKTSNPIEIQNSLSTISPKVKPQAIEIKAAISTAPATPTSSTLTPTPAVVPPPTPPVKHVLQDSTSFMDALIAPPTSSVKKKRRPSASTGSKDSTTAINNDQSSQSGSSPKSGSPPKPFSFYKDMIDEKVDQRADSDSNQNDDNEDEVFLSDSNNDKQTEDSLTGDLDEESTHMNVDIVVPDISVGPSLSLTTTTKAVISDRSSQKIKPILCYVKKGAKKSVRWVEDSRIQAVRFFDLDETERVNVNRPSGSSADLKRYDMKHEAEFMLMARRSANTFDVADDYQSRAETFGAWKLIRCDGDTNLFEVGKESKERAIQADRMRTTLETFYMRHQIPETPQEPEPEIFIGEDQPKVIPLEDDNNPNNCHDFSNVELPQPKTGETLPSRLPDLSKVTVPVPAPIMTPFNNRMPFPAPNQGMGPNVGQQFNSNPPMASFVPNIDPFVAAPPQQFFPSNNGPPPPFQQWSDSNHGGPPPPQHPGPPPQHFVPRFSHGPRGPMGNRPRMGPRMNAQNTVCRHFARTGKCRFQPKCNFLHTNDR